MLNFVANNLSTLLFAVFGLFAVLIQIQNYYQEKIVKERAVDRISQVKSWIEANPQLNVIDHSYPKGLVSEHLVSYFAFISEFSIDRDDEYVDFLIRLLNHKGIKPPSKTKTPPQLRRCLFL